jgi:hypothetical protein
MTRRNWFDLRTQPLSHQRPVMPFLSPGQKYSCAFAKLRRYSGKCSLRATFRGARIDNLIDAVEQQRNKSGFGPAGIQVIANYQHAVMDFHYRLSHSGSVNAGFVTNNDYFR